MKVSQAARILGILSDGQFHCGNEFLGLYMPRYSSAIFELRQKGYGISGVLCELHPKPHAVFMFRLEQRPFGQVASDQMSWIPE